MATVKELINHLSNYKADDIVEFSMNGKTYRYGTMIYSKINDYCKDCDTYKYAKYHNSLQSKEHKAKNIVTVFIGKV